MLPRRELRSERDLAYWSRVSGFGVSSLGFFGGSALGLGFACWVWGKGNLVGEIRCVAELR